MVGSALNLEYKLMVVCVPPVCSISSSVRPTVCSVPRGDDNSIVCDTQLCVPSKVIERKIHQIRKAEDKSEMTPKPSASILSMV